MNPYVLIGLVLVLFCGTKYAYAVPVATTHATNSAAAAENSSDILLADNGKLDNMLYNTIDAGKSVESTNVNHPKNEKTTTRPASETQKSKRKGRRGQSRRFPRTQDCRTTTERPTTPKPTKVYILIPNLFISQSWGPGR